MRKKITAVIAVMLCILMASTMFSPAAQAAQGANDGEQAGQDAGQSAAEAGEEKSDAADTVYVISAADGSTQKVIGSDEEKLPVEISISYKLDGQDIRPEELAGKDGHVAIRFDYKNTTEETVKVGDKDEKVKAPVAVLSGMILDNERFANVEVSRGRTFNDGTRTVVVGLALPGLQEDLGTDREELEDHVEVTADVKDFSLSMTMSVAASDLFDDLKTDSPEDLDGLQDSLDKLADAMKQLLDGSGQLRSGLDDALTGTKTLEEGVGQLSDGAAALSDGAAQLYDGAAQLSDGASELSSGLDTLSASSGDLRGGAKQVFETLLKTADGQIAAAGLDAPALTIGGYADVLNGIISSLDESAVYDRALAEVTAAVEANRDMIRGKVTEAVRSQIEAEVTAAVRENVKAQVSAKVRENVTAGVLAAAGVDAQTYEQMKAAGMSAEIDAAIEAQMASAETAAAADAATEEQMGSEQIAQLIAQTTEAKLAEDAMQQTIDENTENQVQIAISENMAGPEVQARMAEASEGAKALISLKSSLDGYNAFYLGLRSYTEGVDRVADGAKALKDGASQLKSGCSDLSQGAGQLDDGLGTVQKKMPELVSGLTALRDGAAQLDDGLKQFDEEGISKLIDAFDGNVLELLDRIRAVKDAGEQYRQEHGRDIRVIYRTGEITK